MVVGVVEVREGMRGIADKRGRSGGMGYGKYFLTRNLRENSIFSKC